MWILLYSNQSFNHQSLEGQILRNEFMNGAVNLMLLMLDLRRSLESYSMDCNQCAHFQISTVLQHGLCWSVLMEFRNKYLTTHFKEEIKPIASDIFDCSAESKSEIRC